MDVRFSKCQSVIFPLVSSFHEINLLFDCTPSFEIRYVLDICKGFDKIWCQSLLNKLKSHDVKKMFLKKISRKWGGWRHLLGT